MADVETPAGESHGGESRVAYVALGDSLTQGMQSLGVAWYSQQYSYPKLIAEFIGADPFTQPSLRGWDGASEPRTAGVGGKPAEEPTLWFGNPPNIELILRAIEVALAAEDTHQQPGRGRIPLVGANLNDVVDEVVGRFRDTFGIAESCAQGCVPLIAETEYERFRFEDPARVADAEYYQNLGMWGFTLRDITQTAFDPKALKRLPANGMTQALARIDQVAGRLSGEWRRLFHTHPALLGELVRAALLLRSGALMARLGQERLAYVLREPGLTAFDAMAKQQPRIVTLLIGASEILLAESEGVVDAKDAVQPEEFERELTGLVEAILNVPSQPDLFIATLPSPTAGPHLIRGRLGRWSSLFPNSPVLSDADVLLEEAAVANYNEVIRNLAQRYQAAAHPPSAQRVWLVDINKMQARMLRATRTDAETARHAVSHAVRIGLVSQDEAMLALEAVREGDRDLIEYLRTVDQALLTRSLEQVQDLPFELSGGGIKPRVQRWELARSRRTGSGQPGSGTSATATQAREADAREAEAREADTREKDVDAFVVRLKSGQPYRLTGDYVATDEKGVIRQGGAVSLDTLHLTNTGYSYVAREFLRVIYDADKHSEGRILRGLKGSGRNVREFDAILLEVARNDPLLNDAPGLAQGMVDVFSAISGARE